jgi:hypothetical protein
MIAASTFAPVGDAYFSLIAENGHHARYSAGPATGGPWDPRLQPAGPLDAPATVPDVPPGLDVGFNDGSSLEWRSIKTQMGAPGRHDATRPIGLRAGAVNVV